MPVKITLNEVKKITRKTMWQNIGVSTFFLIIGAGTSAIALQELLLGEYGYAVISFLLGILFMFLSVLPVYLIMTEHEVALKYTPSQLDFLSDLELLKAGHLNYADFMKLHAGQVYEMNNVLTEALKQHKDAVQQTPPPQK